MYTYKGTCQLFAGKTKLEEYNHFEEDDEYCLYTCEYKWELYSEEEIQNIMYDKLFEIGFHCTKVEIKHVYENSCQYLIECTVTSPKEISFENQNNDFYIHGIPLYEFQVLENTIHSSLSIEIVFDKL